MSEGFPLMRYQILEDDQTVCLTDCDVSAGVTFAKYVKKMMEKSESLETMERQIEFKDHKENRFVLLKYQIGAINDLNS